MMSQRREDDVFAKPLEIVLEGPPDMVRPIVGRVAREFTTGSYQFGVREVDAGSVLPPGIEIWVVGPGKVMGTTSGRIGVITVEAIPQKRTNLRVPPSGGSKILGFFKKTRMANCFWPSSGICWQNRES